MTLRIGYRQDLVSMVYSRGIRDTEDLCEWVFGSKRREIILTANHSQRIWTSVKIIQNSHSRLMGAAWQTEMADPQATARKKHSKARVFPPLDCLLQAGQQLVNLYYKL